MEIILKIKNLTYHYSNRKHVLKGIHVNIYKGEKLAVVGSNGAGKSTFFLNINGVLKSDNGEIYYRDELITERQRNRLRQNVGIVFQDADQQIIASTVMQEVSFGPMNLKLPTEEVRERVEEALAYMNISDYRDRPPHYLSGGEKKRVSIADILAMKPEVIIFDEPTAGLDPYNTEILEEVLEKLGKEGKTLLISTHDMNFVYRWADRALVFSDGQIIADGTPLEVFSNEEVLKRASLKRPTLMDVYDMLIEKNKVSRSDVYPKTTEELYELL